MAKCTRSPSSRAASAALRCLKGFCSALVIRCAESSSLKGGSSLEQREAEERSTKGEGSRFISRLFRRSCSGALPSLGLSFFLPFVSFSRRTDIR